MRGMIATLLLVLPLAAASGDELARIYERFDHGEHASALERGGLSCVSCHQVGLPGAELPDPPAAACHECHLESPERTLRHRTPTQCQTCHLTVTPPDTHGPTWLAWHGSERDGTCSDCHTRRDCVDCHERRQQPDHRVHEPAFLAIHGIEAAAGATCDTCHSQSECADCHRGSP
jgi:hypothetical protein